MKITLALIKDLGENRDCTWMEQCKGIAFFEKSKLKSTLYPNSRWQSGDHTLDGFHEVDCEYDYHADDISRCHTIDCDAFNWFSKNFSEKQCTEGIEIKTLTSALDNYISKNIIQKIKSNEEKYLNGEISYEELEESSILSKHASIRNWFEENVLRKLAKKEKGEQGHLANSHIANDADLDQG